MKILNFSFIILLFSLKNLYAENKLANDIVIEFHKSLRCLVCEGQSIYDSNAEFANNIKDQTESMLREGKSLVEIENLYLETKNLIELRDILVTKLISGEIKISDTKKIIQEARV